MGILQTQHQSPCYNLAVKKTVILDLFVKETVADKTVLCLGSGPWNKDKNKLNNRYKILIEKSKNWYGADIQLPQENANKNLFYTDLNRLDFFSTLPSNVDIIMLIEVLEHLENPIATLKYIYKNKPKNTKLLISVPNGNSLGRLLFAIFNTPKLHTQDKYHNYVFNEQTLINTLRAAGFTNIICYPYVPNKKRQTLLSFFPNLTNGFIALCN